MTVYRRQRSNLAAPSLYALGYDTIDIPGDWVEQAVCASTDPAIFFPEDGEWSFTAAKKVCAACPVTAECLAYALANEGNRAEIFGVYGGLTANERYKLRRHAEAPSTCALPGCDLPVRNARGARYCTKAHASRRASLRYEAAHGRGAS